MKLLNKLRNPFKTKLPKAPNGLWAVFYMYSTIILLVYFNIGIYVFATYKSVEQ